MKKYIITFVDTENVSPDIVGGLISLVDYTYKDYNNLGYFCFGIDDGKSNISVEWKKRLGNPSDFRWISVKGERSKNLVDKSIIRNITRMINDSYYSPIDVWVIVSSDGDYCSVIKAIREKGHKVIVASPGTVSEKLRKACSEFFPL